MSDTATAVRFFIGVPGDDQASGIFGIGLSDEAAVADAYRQSNSHEPVVTDSSENGFPEWHVATDNGENLYFNNEGEARDYAIQKGFIGRECTERLFRHIERHGCDATTFRWNQSFSGLGLDDLDVDQAIIDRAVAWVKEAIAADTDGVVTETTTQSALEDAHAYVEIFLVHDVDADRTLQEAIKRDRELRTAIDVAMKGLLLAGIAEREAA